MYRRRGEQILRIDCLIRAIGGPRHRREVQEVRQVSGGSHVEGLQALEVAVALALKLPGNHQAARRWCACWICLWRTVYPSNWTSWSVSPPHPRKDRPQAFRATFAVDSPATHRIEWSRYDHINTERSGEKEPTTPETTAFTCPSKTCFLHRRMLVKIGRGVGIRLLSRAHYRVILSCQISNWASAAQWAENHK